MENGLIEVNYVRTKNGIFVTKQDLEKFDVKLSKDMFKIDSSIIVLDKPVSFLGKLERKFIKSRECFDNGYGFIEVSLFLENTVNEKGVFKKGNIVRDIVDFLEDGTDPANYEESGNIIYDTTRLFVISNIETVSVSVDIKEDLDKILINCYYKYYYMLATLSEFGGPWSREITHG